MELERKLAILADAAKYDASCSSSGAKPRSAEKDGLGSTSNGICHSYTPDGRCVSLLKILLTNFCLYECAYCVNRRSSNVPRARFTVDEVVNLTLGFYRRNYIEGLFLSSGIIQSPDYTMEQVVSVARKLRVEHKFAGYIHLKTIPEASPELLAEAGRYADRLSINIELPTVADLGELAPQKNWEGIDRMMGRIAENIASAKPEPKPVPAAAASSAQPAALPLEVASADEAVASATRRNQRPAGAPPPFAPAGQTTQMVVGATPTTDAAILRTADQLYSRHRLRRVYYSAFSPIPDASSHLPLQAPPLVREHRLYQADWLLRFYGFDVGEILPADSPQLDLELNPKLAWALRNRHRFPVDLNTAERAELLRVPGLGVRNADRVLAIRRWTAVRLADLVKLRVNLAQALPFIVVADHSPHRLGLDDHRLRARFLKPPEQLDLFAPPAPRTSVAPRIPGYGQALLSDTAPAPSPLIDQQAPTRGTNALTRHHPVVSLPAPGDFDSWRDQARDLLARSISPHAITWSAADQPDLFNDGPTGTNPAVLPSGPLPRVPRAFLDIARVVAAHAEPSRWARLYSVLWRLTHGEPHLLDITSDSDVNVLVLLERAVRKEVHKLTAFVRFRTVPAPELGPSAERYLAWFEPEHDILPLGASFFVRRFASMHWSILTPRRSVHWDGERLAFAPGVPREAAPADDSLEPLWRTYYAHIFNPARVKVAAMVREMPRRYWKNLPETEIVHDLLAQAPARTAAMLAASRVKSNATPLP